MKDWLMRTLAEHADALARLEYSSVDLTRASLARIAEREGELHAFLHVDEAGALRAAAASDARRARGEARGPLDGIPFSLKDNFAAKGQPMTCGSRILEHYIAPYDATVTARLLAAGAVLLGKNNMDEFAMGSSGEYSAFSPIGNPHSAAHVAGGSSGGSAAAVAAGEAVFSLGTDTGGSVRQPAAFCGVYGLKPTYGLLSRFGVAAMATSLDAVGLLTRSSADAALLLPILAGQDARDATSRPFDENGFGESFRAPLERLRVAVVEDLLSGTVQAEVAQAVRDAARVIKECGGEIVSVSFPTPGRMLAAYTVLASTEAASDLARYDGIHYGERDARATLGETYAKSRAALGEEVKRRILFGTDMLRAENRERYYLRAMAVREEVRAQMLAWMERFDLILTPTSPTTPFLRGSTPSPEWMYEADLCCVSANLSGLPALSVPYGYDCAGLPLAVQLTAGPFGEGRLLRAAQLLSKGKEGAL